MLRSAVGKVVWVGRATVFLVGLAVILAVVLGAASTAMGASGGAFILGKGINTADKVTGLIGEVATGSAFLVRNPSGGSALHLGVGDPRADPATKTVAPLRVDSQAKVRNLNADSLDGRDAGSFANATHGHSGEEISSGTVAEPRVDAALARDEEVVPKVLAGDGQGSGLDADTLDGKSSSGFVERNLSLGIVVNGGSGMVETTTLSGVSSAKTATGSYEITLPAAGPNVAFCALSGNAEADDPVLAAARYGGPKKITVKAYDLNGVLVDPMYVDVIANCGTSAGGTAAQAAGDARPGKRR